MSLRVSLSLYQCYSVSFFARTIVTPCQSSPVPMSLRVSLSLYQCHSVSVLACTNVTPCSLRLYHCHSVSVFACTSVNACSFRSLYTVIPSDTRIFISLFNYSIFAISVLSDQLFGFVSPYKSRSGHRYFDLFVVFLSISKHFLGSFFRPV
jgi:hypothetical protein